MIRITLMSDNHSYLGQDVLNHILDSDEVWHAGDMGSMDSVAPLMEGKIFRGVYGNIDDRDIRTVFPCDLFFTTGGLKVYMTHIGGYPGKYNPRVYPILQKEKPDLFICGHSHICKVMHDKSLNLLHMNPGAYGHHGFHVVRTLLKFNILDGQVKDLHVVELGMRGRIG